MCMPVSLMCMPVSIVPVFAAGESEVVAEESEVVEESPLLLQATNAPAITIMAKNFFMYFIGFS